MVARISLVGFVTHEIALTEGPMEWIDLHGRHHGAYWLFKTDHFHVDLETVAPLSPAPSLLKAQSCPPSFALSFRWKNSCAALNRLSFA